jgi:hypothetical protein
MADRVLELSNTDERGETRKLTAVACLDGRDCDIVVSQHADWLDGGEGQRVGLDCDQMRELFNWLGVMLHRG